MSISADIIRNHIEYNGWATERVLVACQTLAPEQRERDFGTADKSVAGTLIHLFRSERVWLQRVRGQEQTPKLPADVNWALLNQEWPAMQNQWREWAASLTDQETARVMHYSDLKGNPQSNLTWQTVLHVVNHSTHHRGQVMGFLRALGVTPPALDFIAFVRTRSI